MALHLVGLDWLMLSSLHVVKVQDAAREEGITTAMRRIALLIALICLLFAMQPTNAVLAAQYNPPWVHLYGINDPPMDTTQLQWGEPFFDATGYNCYYSSTLSAYGEYTNMKSDAIYIYDGHANTTGGMIFPWGGQLVADGGVNTDPTYYISNYAANDISDLLLFMPMGCGTANTDTTYGNLLDAARAKGADVAIGWTGLLYDNTSDIFGMGFARGTQYTTYSIDSPVGYNSGDTDLMGYAYGYMWNNTPNATRAEKQSLLTWVTKGQYAQTTNPPRYGTP